MKMLSKFFRVQVQITDTILNILLIFYNVLKTLKWNYMLNLTSDKNSETLFRL